MANPNPTAAHNARRKYAVGTQHITARIDSDLLAIIDREKDEKTLAQWSSRSDIINYALALVEDEIKNLKGETMLLPTREHYGDPNDMTMEQWVDLADALMLEWADKNGIDWDTATRDEQNTAFEYACNNA